MPQPFPPLAYCADAISKSKALAEPGDKNITIDDPTRTSLYCVVFSSESTTRTRKNLSQEEE
ncbi:hypothetical protein BaRGS_00023057, partial [Batillaria attramentaria]